MHELHASHHREKLVSMLAAPFQLKTAKSAIPHATARDEGRIMITVTQSQLQGKPLLWVRTLQCQY